MRKRIAHHCFSTAAALFLVSNLTFAGCGGTAGPSIEPDDIQLSLNSLNDSDFLVPGVLEKDENIGNGNSDPWGDFIDAATEFCGADPVGFEPIAATVTLFPATSTNVDDLSDLVDGTIEMHFLDTSGSDADATRVILAASIDPSGVGPIEMDVVSNRSDMDALYEPLLGGDFHVGVNVETALSENDSFSADLGLSLGIRAHCE